MAAAPHVVITGMMGVGKTTVASAVAQQLSLPHRDSDDDLVALTGATGAELARTYGVDELHRLEAAVLLGALAHRGPLVISAAAWVVEDPWCRSALRRRAFVAVLRAPLAQLLERIPTGPHRRQIERAELARIEARRGPLFAAVADTTIDAAEPVADVTGHLLTDLADYRRRR